MGAATSSFPSERADYAEREGGQPLMAGPIQGWGAQRRRRLAGLALAMTALFVADACGARTAPYLGGGVQAGQASNNNGSDNATSDTAGTGAGTGTDTGGAVASGSNTGTGSKTATGTKTGTNNQPAVSDAKSFDYTPKA